MQKINIKIDPTIYKQETHNVQYHITKKMVRLENEKRLTGGIILDEHLKEIILVKGKLADKWSLPKGHLEPGESYLEGALREIKEETGLDIELKIDVLPCILTNRGKLFLMSIPKEKCHFKIEDTNEIGEVRWYPLSKLKTLPKQNYMLRSLHDRIGHIKWKIKCNQKNYINDANEKNLNTKFQQKNQCQNNKIVLNEYLWRFFFIQSLYNRTCKEILDVILNKFPKLYYEPELRLGFHKVINDSMIA